MGHKGSAKYSGAQGQVVQLDDAEIERTLRADQVSPVQEAAAKHREKAIKTLADCMDAEDSSWPAKCTAARDILAYSDGRPPSQSVADPNAGGAGITINILRLSDGVKEEIHIPAPRPQDVVELLPLSPEAESAVERAQRLLGGAVE